MTVASALGRGSGDAAHQLFVELADAAQVVADQSDAGGVEPFELRPAGELDLAVDARPQLSGGGGRGDHHAPPVAGVGHAVGVAVALHAVEDGSDRPRGQAALLGELAGRDAATAVEDADAAQVGAVQALLGGYRLVETVGGAAQLAELRPDVVDQLVRGLCHVTASHGKNMPDGTVLACREMSP